MNKSNLKKININDISWDIHYVPFNDQSSGNRSYIRHIFLAYCLMFNMKDTCGYPMHVLIADLVNSYSGSSELLNSLCRLGVTVSSRSHQRFVDQILSLEKQSEMPDNLIKPDTFTCFSVDNLDKHFSHASAQFGKKNRIWDVTTVMANQPLPHSLNSLSDIMTSSSADHEYNASSSADHLYNTSISADHQYSPTSEPDAVSQEVTFNTHDDTDKVDVPVSDTNTTTKRKDWKHPVKDKINYKIPAHVPTVNQNCSRRIPSRSFYSVNPEESDAFLKFDEETLMYVLERNISGKYFESKIIPRLRAKFYLDDR